MSRRLILAYDIAGRREAPCDVAAPEDFTLAWASSNESIALPGTSLAYCADFSTERVLFTQHDPAGLQQLFAAPFLFTEQLANARSVTAIPFERLAESGLATPDSRPAFVFSPGRTGSTLLTRLLAAAGLPCASEPDMLTQIAGTSRANRLKLPAGMETELAAACISALGHALGPGAFIKLRSQCNASPLTFIKAAPACRVVFMLRGMRGWALSRHRTFQEPAESVAAVLRQALDALDKLAGAGVPFDIIWFETLLADPYAALRICAAGRPVEAPSLASVMLADAQQGTGIARDIVASLPVQQGFMAAFAAAWAEARAGARWSQRTEALLARMWDG